MCDYHFGVQRNDGTWADKPGSNPAKQDGYVNPTTADWTYDYGYGNIANYDSDTICFAITRQENAS